MTKAYVIFGGAGFIGLHTAYFLMESGWSGKIFLCDIKKPSDHPAFVFLKNWIESGRIEYLEVDVRSSIDLVAFAQVRVERIYNFAAIHREPGHHRVEYFETNILGAENVCKFASAVSCTEIVFTSSISPYGPSEQEIYETSLTSPETPYGSSKLAAEYIHKLWLGMSEERRLLILRPGVVFGPGEGGNVTRLVKMLSRFRIFFRVGDRNIRKAGIYVKELCSATEWLLARLKSEKSRQIVSNMTFDPGPTLDEYVAAVASVACIKPRVIPVPSFILMSAARIINVVLNGTSLAAQLDPVRVRKITRSNNVRAGYLVKHGYAYKYDLGKAFSDWRVDMPGDWKK